MARELGQSRVLLICTYRDMELNRRHPLTVTLGDLARERLYEPVLLRLPGPFFGLFVFVSGVVLGQGLAPSSGIYPRERTTADLSISSVPSAVPLLLASARPRL